MPRLHWILLDDVWLKFHHSTLSSPPLWGGKIKWVPGCKFGFPKGSVSSQLKTTETQFKGTAHHKTYPCVSSQSYKRSNHVPTLLGNFEMLPLLLKPHKAMVLLNMQNYTALWLSVGCGSPGDKIKQQNFAEVLNPCQGVNDKLRAESNAEGILQFHYHKQVSRRTKLCFINH